MNIIDKQTGEVIGSVMTNQSLTFDEIMRLAGFEYVETGNENGWTRDGEDTPNRVFYDESLIEISD